MSFKPIIHQRLPRNARWAILLSELLVSMALVGMLLAVYAGLNHFRATLPPVVFTVFYVVAVLLIIWEGLDLILEPTVGFHYYHYTIAEDRIAVDAGAVRRKREILPMRRVQKVEMSAGPIRRALGLATLEIYSAGSSLSIDHMALADAEMWAETLKNKVNAIIEAEDEQDA